MQRFVHFTIQSHLLVSSHHQPPLPSPHPAKPPHPSPHYAKPSCPSHIHVPSHEKSCPTSHLVHPTCHPPIQPIPTSKSHPYPTASSLDSTLIPCPPITDTTEVKLKILAEIVFPLPVEYNGRSREEGE
jgi:hypothetical protein